MVNNMNAVAEMTYEEFAAAYRSTFAKMMSYELNQVGCAIYCEKLAELAEAHPEWAEQVEAE